MELIEEECKINDSVVGSMENIDSYVQSLGCSEFVAVWRDMESLYSQNEGIKSSFLSLYDSLRTTTY